MRNAEVRCGPVVKPDDFRVPRSAFPLRSALRIEVQYADFCNVGGDPATVAHKYVMLREHCAQVRRPYEVITRSNDVGILIAVDERELAAKKPQHGRISISSAPRKRSSKGCTATPKSARST
jgi:hypothetical protein